MEDVPLVNLQSNTSTNLVTNRYRPRGILSSQVEKGLLHVKALPRIAT